MRNAAQPARPAFCQPSLLASQPASGLFGFSYAPRFCWQQGLGENVNSKVGDINWLFLVIESQGNQAK